MNNSAYTGEVDGVPFTVLDLNGLRSPGFIPGFYYSVGEPEVDDFEEADGKTEIVTLEGPYATLAIGIHAAREFIEELLDDPSLLHLTS